MLRLPALTAKPAHVWTFFRAGGFDQVSLTTAADIAAVGDLDLKLWAALACPVKGLEFDYVGVIIGEDLRIESGALITDHTKRAKSDASLRGIKSMMKADPERATRVADEIIRNTYRVLMTRGMKGCYVFCADPALASYLRAGLPQRSAYVPAVRPLSFAAE